MNSSLRWLVLGLVLGIPASAAAGAGRRLEAGPWGGDAVLLDVTTDGALLEFECARGQISTPVMLDDHGDFDVPGTFSPESHGPTRDGTAAARARYQGHIEGDTMTLTVVRADEKLGPYALTRDRRPILKKCR